MTARRLLLATAAVSTLVAAPPALAQDDRRVDQLEKQVRELRAIIFQGRDTGQPVEVRPAGPDPAVTALEQRVGALEDTQRTLKGQLEELGHNVDEARSATNIVRNQRSPSLCSTMGLAPDPYRTASSAEPNLPLSIATAANDRHVTDARPGCSGEYSTNGAVPEQRTTDGSTNGRSDARSDGRYEFWHAKSV